MARFLHESQPQEAMISELLGSSKVRLSLKNNVYFMYLHGLCDIVGPSISTSLLVRSVDHHHFSVPVDQWAPGLVIFYDIEV